MGYAVRLCSFRDSVAPWVDRFGSAQARVPIQTLQEARDSITSISIPPSSAGGAEIVTGCVDGVVRSYDVRMGKLVSDTIGGEVLFFFPFRSVEGGCADLSLVIRSPGNECCGITDSTERFGLGSVVGLLDPVDGPHEWPGTSPITPTYTRSSLSSSADPLTCVRSVRRCSRRSSTTSL